MSRIQGWVVAQAQQETQAHKGPLVLKAHKVLQDRRELKVIQAHKVLQVCLLYTSPSPRDS